MNTINRDAWSSIPIIEWEQVTGWKFMQSNLSPNRYRFIITEKPISNNSFAVFTRPFMEPLFRSGSVLIIDPKKDLQDGVYVLLSFANQEPTIRMLNFDGNTIYLKHIIKINEPLHELDNNITIHGTIIECRTSV